MSKKAGISINWGWVGPTISEQLKKHGLALPEKVEAAVETLRKGVNSGYVNGYISRREMEAIFKRAAKDVSKNLLTLKEEESGVH